MRSTSKRRAARANWRTGALALTSLACLAGLGPGAALATGGTGTLLGWGDNSQGELGNGATSMTPSYAPTGVSAGAIPTGTAFTQVAAGGFPFFSINDFSLALSSAGKVYAWGTQISGVLGNGVSSSTSDVPVAVSQGAIPAGTTITQIAAGTESAFALSSTGKLYAWGGQEDGGLGDGVTSSVAVAATPVAVSPGAIPAGATVTQVAASEDYAAALTSAGNVYTWGFNGSGQLGNASNANSNVPVAVSQGAIPAGTKIVQIAAGPSACYALSSTGHVYAWGAGDLLGNNSSSGSEVPVAVSAGAIPSGTTITQIAAGGDFALALTSSGSVYAWGNGSDGDLGDGSMALAGTPVAVSIPSGTRITHVAASASTGYAVSSTGAVYAWGDNTYGELGNGASATANSDVPVAVALPSGTSVDAIAQGSDADHLLAIVGDLAVSTGSLPGGMVGVPYSAAVSATGGAGGDVWSASGLPAGLSINSSSGAITGTPTAAGTSTVSVTVTDEDGLTASASLPVGVTTFGAAAITLTPATGAIGFAEPLTGPGTLSWTLTFPNGSNGIFAAKRHKAPKPKCTASQVKLKGRCRPATVSFGSGSTAVTGAGTASFTVTPSASALKALKTALTHHRGVAVTATLSFQSALGGTPVTETQTVIDTLAKPKPKPKHKRHRK